MAELQYNPFVVNEMPFCMWDWDISKHNLEFLDSINPNYFAHISAVYKNQLEGEEKHYAATALRIAYSHGLETLFALLCATVQAPDCVVGWMLKYQNRDLNETTRKIHERRPILSKLQLPSISWMGLSRALMPFTTGDKEKDERIRRNFANLWQYLAADFLKEGFDQEYNSIKHGLRIHMGGFHFAIAFEQEPGVSASLENAHPWGGSIFGSSYYSVENLVNRTNFRVKHQKVNWNPLRFVYALELLSMSINNVISFLKILNGVPLDKVEIIYPTDEEVFNLPWEQRVMIDHLREATIIIPEMISPLSPQDILAMYPKLINNDSHPEINVQ